MIFTKKIQLDERNTQYIDNLFYDHHIQIEYQFKLQKLLEREIFLIFCHKRQNLHHNLQKIFIKQFNLEKYAS